MRTAIEQRFGSLDKWSTDFLASAKEAVGWAMLVRHPVNGKLYNVVSDEHAIGLLWMAVPLVVIDTCEHAFYSLEERRTLHLRRADRALD